MAHKPPARYWRSYGTDRCPTGKEAMDEPFSAFPSWYLRVICDRCGKDRIFVETHFARRDLPIRDIIRRRSDTTAAEARPARRNC